MKLNNHDNHGPHNHSEQNGLKKPSKIKQYLQSLYTSRKCKAMSHGSYDIVRSMSWARGENWRRNHAKSLGKQHLSHGFSSNKTKHK